MIKSRLGKYEIIKWLGGGSFGDVYAARDTLLDKVFALKVARAREKDIVLLKKEAKILSELLYPGIIRFFTIEYIEERLVLVMEYVDGASLKSILERGALSLEEALRITKEILQSLDYAHSQNVLHRDIKPENILIQKKDNRVKITDFGLGALFKGNVLSLSVAGTPLYLAPEAWKGYYFPQTDLFAVACILYQMLTGRPPFLSDNLDTLKEKMIKGNYPPLKREYPEFIRKLIKKSLDPNWAKRFPSAKAMLQAMEREEIKDALLARGRILDGKTDTSKDLFKDLTEEQKAAVIKDKGFILVWGGAGCGKTYVLARKIAYLIIEKKVSPFNILVCTFTGKTLQDLKQKIEKGLSREIFLQLNIGTFHNIALQILYNGAHRIDFPTDSEFQILNRAEQIQVLKKVSKNLGEAQLKSVLSEIQLAKAHLLSAEKMEEYANSSYQKFCAKIYKEYQNYLFEKRAMDYDDILMFAVHILEKFEDIRERFSKLYEYILVDEFQDVNAAQVNLLIHLSSFHKNLYVTGDPDQAIYGFRGASTRWFEKFKELFQSPEKEVTVLRLTKSFRIPEEIFNPAFNLISHNHNTKDKNIFLPSKKGQDKALQIYRAENEREEADFISFEIKNIIDKGKNLEDIAILFRTASKGGKIEESLIKNRIPYSLEGKGNFYSRKEIIALVNYLEFLLKGKKNCLKTAIDKFIPLGELSTKEIIDAILKDKKTDIIEIEKMKEILKRHMKYKQELSPFEILDEFLCATGYLEFLQKKQEPSYMEEEENIKDFLLSSRNFGHGKIKEFIDSFSLMQFISGGKRESGVSLMTVHSAKGLEFPVCFIVGLVEGSFPLARTLSNKKELEEERRLFYVALTRATEKVYLTYPLKRFNLPATPSRFIEEMFIE